MLLYNSVELIINKNLQINFKINIKKYKKKKLENYKYTISY